ncbi:MAG TPA: NAD-dependent epimerase/dehydratase family protein, partial [Gemmatimonadaceae bacterium]|nr:NAD-dependent epimerase/dehydratase family protein [Gemmatimonadaceae bacterium]
MPRMILVTGAGGFVGGRIVEVLHELNDGTVRGGVRRWSSAARIGRLPVDIAPCDVRSAASVRAAMKDVTAVVHCAHGDFETNAEGTRNVLAEAQRANVERVIHLSSVAVHGRSEGSIAESSALAGSDEYALSKIRSEEICAEYTARGLNVVVLRPTIVYGPYSNLWTVEFAQRLKAGEWFLPETYTQGICNLVYVDDLVKAVILSLQSDRAPGETFIINGAERPTWNEYFHALNDALGFPPLRPASSFRSRARAGAMLPVRKTAKFMLKRFQPLVLNIYQRSKLAKSIMRRAETAIRNSPTHAEFDLYSLKVSYDGTHAANTLGYRPAFSMSDGVQLSVSWL